MNEVIHEKRMPLYKKGAKNIDLKYLPVIGRKKGVISPLNSAKPGDVVQYGRYPFDKTGEDVRPIEWRVLDIRNGRLLLITEYGIDNKLYDNYDVETTWENCELRKWLNGEFLDTAFNESEKAGIPAADVTADTNPYFSTDPGNDTVDRVFLLSDREAGKYWTRRWARRCLPTEYAEAKGIYTFRKHCWWWLRTPGNFVYTAAVTFGVGIIHHFGYRVNNKDVCVRPSIWVNQK